jgi:hypothetical protein
LIHIDQVRTLDIKVKQAVQLISQLKRENDHLRSRLADTEVRVQEMENLLNTLKNSQNQMEQGIKLALDELGQIEVPAGIAEDTEVTSSGVVDVEPELAKSEEIVKIEATKAETAVVPELDELTNSREEQLIVDSFISSSTSEGDVISDEDLKKSEPEETKQSGLGFF